MAGLRGRMLIAVVALDFVTCASSQVETHDNSAANDTYARWDAKPAAWWTEVVRNRTICFVEGETCRGGECGTYEHNTTANAPKTSFKQIGFDRFIELLRIEHISNSSFEFEGWVMTLNPLQKFVDQNTSSLPNSYMSLLPGSMYRAPIDNVTCYANSIAGCAFGESFFAGDCTTSLVSHHTFPAPESQYGGGMFELFNDSTCTHPAPGLQHRHVISEDGCDDRRHVPWSQNYSDGTLREFYMSMHCEAGQARICSQEAPRVRLHGGPNSSSGLLQVRTRGEWGTVCDDKFDIDGAGDKNVQVVCRSLGFSGGSWTSDSYTYSTSNSYLDRINTSILLDDVNCAGNEESIFDCSHQTLHNCNHREDIYITCGSPEHWQVTPQEQCRLNTKVETPYDTDVCSPVLQVGQCFPVISDDDGNAVWARVGCGESFGSILHSVHGVGEVEFDSDCSAPSMDPATIVFQDGEQCVPDNNPAGVQYVKLGSCNSETDSIDILGYGCNEICSECEVETILPWVYNASNKLECTRRQYPVTMSLQGGGNFTFNKPMATIYGSVVCPGTHSPTMAPTAAPVTSAPTLSPTTSTCSRCVNGTSGVCRYIGTNVSRYGECFDPDPRRRPREGQTYVTNCLLDSEEAYNDDYANPQLCAESVERCSVQTNLNFEASSDMLEMDTDNDYPELCTAPSFLGAGGYLMTISGPNNYTETWAAVEDMLPTFSTLIRVNISASSPWRDATHECLSFCCGASEWCYNTYVSLNDNNYLTCSLMSDVETIVAAGVDLPALNCNISNPASCMKYNVSLGDGSVVGNWNFTFGISPIGNRDSGSEYDGPKRGRRDDVLNTGIIAPPGYSASNATFYPRLDHCDALDSSTFFLFQQSTPRYFFRFFQHPRPPLTWAPTDSPTTSIPTRSPVPMTASPVSRGIIPPTSAPTVSIATALAETTTNASIELARLTFDNGTVEDVLVEAANIVTNAVRDMFTSLNDRDIDEEDLLSGNSAESIEVITALSDAWNLFQDHCENITLEGAKYLDNNTIGQGVADDGSMILTSIKTNDLSKSLQWPFADPRFEGSAQCLDPSQRLNESSVCYTRTNDTMILPPLLLAGAMGDLAFVSFVSYSAAQFQLLARSSPGLVVGSQVVSATIDGVEHHREFDNNATMTFNFSLTNPDYINPDGSLNNAKLSDPPCKFWNEPTSKWISDGCESTIHYDDISGRPLFVQCVCNHLTSFAVLMDTSENDATLSEKQQRDLSIFIYVCVGISIVCLTAVAVVYLVFSSLRTQSKTILLHLCIIYDITLVLFLINDAADLEGDTCRGFGAALHFALFSTFLWMLAEGHQLYQTFVNVFEAYRTDEWKQLHMYVAGCYGIPLLLVVLVVAIWPEAYRDTKFCFLANDNGAVWLFVAPALTVIAANIFSLIMVSRAIFAISGARKPRSSTTSETISKAKRGFKSALMFGSIMGLTWAMGIVSIFAAEDIVYEYVFAFFNALGGLWIFAFHLIMDPEVKKRVRRSTASNSSSRMKKNKKGGVIRRADQKYSSTQQTSSNTGSSFNLSTGGTDSLTGVSRFGSPPTSMETRLSMQQPLAFPPHDVSTHLAPPTTTGSFVGDDMLFGTQVTDSFQRSNRSKAGPSSIGYFN